MAGRRYTALLLSVILLIAAAFRLWGMDFGLPHPMTRPDEEFIVSMALRFFSGDFNPHFFEWPSLYFYLVHAIFRVYYAIGYATGRFTDATAFVTALGEDPTSAHLILRLMSAGAGIATLLVVYRFTSAIFDRTTAVCAAAFLAVAYLHIRDSHFGVLDVPLTFLVMLSVHLLYRAAAQPESRRRWIVAGICGGLATSVKYNAAALLVAALAAWIAAVAGSTPSSRFRVLSGLPAFAAAFVAAFLIGSPYLVLDFSAFREGLAAQVIRLTEGHGIRIEQVWLRHLTFSLRYGLGLPVLVAAGVGAVLLVLRRPRTAALVLAFPASYFVVIGGGHTAFIRYATPLVPFFCILAAYAASEVVTASSGFLREKHRGFVLALVVTVMALPSVLTAARFVGLLTKTDTRLVAADWLAGQIKEEDSLFESGASYARPHYAWSSGEGTRKLLDFDPARAQFSGSAAVDTLPEWIVVAESPLRLYTRVPPELRTILSSRYVLRHTVPATTQLEPEAAFDRQDAFFLPYADFSARLRPGPELSIYRRSDDAR